MLVLLLGMTACSVQETEIPALTGPSGFALSLKVQAVPDSILRDGASQATIRIEARGGDGAPVRGLSLRVETVYQGAVQDFGTLSAKTVVTGENGVASTVYTAPPRPLEPVDQTTIVTFRVTPIGGSPGTPYADYRGAVSRTADLRLVTPGEIRPPNSAPVAQFTVSSTSPTIGQTVTFDASGSTDGGAPCGVACTYSWDFGDGHSGTGMFTTHVYTRVGNYQVRLTVTDAGGASHTIALTINVGAGQAPTAAFTFSPASPAVSQDIFFNASASTAAPGRTIVSYEWDFGSGRTATGVTVTKRYDRAGEYVVTLKVTDDMGQTGVTQNTVTVGGTP
jgi:PKD repeat protein